MIKLEEIAKLAGVSKATASLALNNKPGINEDTRQKILSIIKEYNYRPLRQRKKESKPKYTIRILYCVEANRFLNIESSHFSQMRDIIKQKSKDYGISLIINLLSLGHFEEELIQLENALPSDLIMLLGTDVPEMIINKLNQLHPRVLVTDCCYDFIENYTIGINNQQGAFLATEYLISKGHRDIGYAMSKHRIINFQERKLGFEAALNRHKLNLNYKHLTMSAKEFDATPKNIIVDNLPSAFFCENDVIAINLMNALKAKGIRIPEDISIVGFDDINEAKIISPSLTTINQVREESVMRAFELIFEILEKPEKSPVHIRTSTKLIERESVKSII